MFRFVKDNPRLKTAMRLTGVADVHALAAILDLGVLDAFDLMTDGAAYDKIPDAAVELAVWLRCRMADVLYVTDDAPDAASRWEALRAVDHLIASERAA
ncbi:hypothetical protein ACGFJ7_24390 [Actinoplanes sp. NPDC048988]|uniref:hypothetical protein n=1 Tax=Actinoplanes sp. NPDC048988 TaxID=3363901 RepID=UPI003715459E